MLKWKMQVFALDVADLGTLGAFISVMSMDDMPVRTLTA